MTASHTLGPVADALRALLDHVDRNTCEHEDTTRGGTNWTICQRCGKKWADDEGGFVAHSDAKPVARAREILNALKCEPADKEVDRVLSLFASIADGYDEAEDDAHQVWKDFDNIGSSLPLKLFRDARSARDDLRVKAAAAEPMFTAIGYARRVDVDERPLNRPLTGRTSFWCNERQSAYYDVPVYARTTAAEATSDGTVGDGQTPPTTNPMNDLIADLDEIRRAVFGDIGDEPNVYADYDRCSELQGMMRRAIERLHKGGPGTPSSLWARNGDADPHGSQYDCERAELTLGHLTDDQIANDVFLNPDISRLTAAKERIRWLSRSLEGARRHREVGSCAEVPGRSDLTMATFPAHDVPAGTVLLVRREAR